MKWVFLAVLSLGCSPVWKCQQAEVRMQFHPWKPLPAKLVSVRCDKKEAAAYLCDDVTVTTQDKDGKRSLLCGGKEKAVFHVHD